MGLEGAFKWEQAIRNAMSLETNNAGMLSVSYKATDSNRPIQISFDTTSGRATYRDSTERKLNTIEIKHAQALAQAELDKRNAFPQAAE